MHVFVQIYMGVNIFAYIFMHTECYIVLVTLIYITKKSFLMKNHLYENNFEFTGIHVDLNITVLSRNKRTQSQDSFCVCL